MDDHLGTPDAVVCLLVYWIRCWSGVAEVQNILLEAFFSHHSFNFEYLKEKYGNMRSGFNKDLRKREWAVIAEARKSMLNSSDMQSFD